MRARRFLVFCAAAFLSAQPLFGFAQDPVLPSGPLLTPTESVPTPAPADLQTLPHKEADESIDPADIPDILLAEMAEVENNCMANAMYSSFHDCRCIAVKFLDARLKSDPDRSKDGVFNSVSSQCPNPPGIAGYIYKSCADVMRNERPKDFDRLCACSANHVANDYTKAPTMSVRYIDSLRKKALIDCGIGNNPAYNSPYLQK